LSSSCVARVVARRLIEGDKSVAARAGHPDPTGKGPGPVERRAMSDFPLWFQAVLLGVVQGLTEFLPVSSSAHLVLLPALGGGQYFGKSFDVALHGGTLVALISAMPREAAAFGRVLAGLFQARLGGNNPEERLALLALVGALPAALAGFVLESRAEHLFHGIPLLAGALAIFGLLMAAVDRRAGRARELAGFGMREAFLVGLAQALALIPGVSRSGATLTAARALGVCRPDAARLSFLFAFPVLGGATLVKALRGFELPSPDLVGPLAAGVAAAALSGTLGLGLLRRHLEGGSLAPFAWYRVVLGLGLLLWVGRGL